MIQGCSKSTSRNSFFEQDQFNNQPGTATVSLLQLLLAGSSTSSEQNAEDSEENFCQKRRVLRRKRKKRLGLVSDGINSYVDFSDFWNGSKWLCTNSDTYRYVKSSGTFPALDVLEAFKHFGEKHTSASLSASTFLCLFWAGNSQHITGRERSEVALSSKQP